MKPSDIQAALVERLKEAFPGEAVYTDLTPRDFERPSNLVELAGMELDALGTGLSAVQLRWRWRLTTFCQVDQVHDSHLPELDLRAMLVMSLFGAGYVRVKDRALKVTACTADTGSYDAAEVTAVLSLTVDRSEFAPSAVYETMRELSARCELKEEKAT